MFAFFATILGEKNTTFSGMIYVGPPVLNTTQLIHMANGFCFAEGTELVEE